MSSPVRRDLLLAPNLLAASARLYGDQVAIEGAGRSLCYDEVARRANRLANALGAMGVGRGDTVAIFVSNRVECLEAYYGVSTAGAAFIPMVPRLTAPEVAYQLADSAATAIITEQGMLAALSEAPLPADRWLVMDHDGGPGISYDGVLAAASEEPPEVGVQEDDLYCVRYTSGTTGKPKGSVNTQRAWWLIAMSMAHEWGFTDRDVTLANAPFAHVSGMLAFAHVAVGGSVVVHKSFDVTATVDAVERGGITNMFMVPTQYAMVLEHLAGRQLSSPTLRTIFSSAAPLSGPLKSRITAAFPGVGLHEFYAATETPMVTDLRPDEQGVWGASVGKPRFFGTSVRILGDGGSPLPPGEVGEIWVSNPMIHAGYHNRPDVNAATMRDGYVSVGDLGRVDEHGFLYIVDRKSDMIISGGFNVYPREVEEAIAHHPAVAQAAVFGLPDDRWGERVCAAVVLHAEASFSQGELRDWLKERLAGYKVPRAVAVLEALPVNSGGKVLRRSLRDALQNSSALQPMA